MLKSGDTLDSTYDIDNKKAASIYDGWRSWLRGTERDFSLSPLHVSVSRGPATWCWEYLTSSPDGMTIFATLPRVESGPQSREKQIHFLQEVSTSDLTSQSCKSCDQSDMLFEVHGSSRTSSWWLCIRGGCVYPKPYVCSKESHLEIEIIWILRVRWISDGPNTPAHKCDHKIVEWEYQLRSTPPWVALINRLGRLTGKNVRWAPKEQKEIYQNSVSVWTATSTTMFYGGDILYVLALQGVFRYLRFSALSFSNSEGRTTSAV